jgi:archaemetzincin
LGNIAASQVDSVALALGKAYGPRIHVAAHLSMPAHALTTVRGPRYRADTIIAWLRDIMPDTIDHVIGITSQDISITKRNEDGTIKEPESKYVDFGVFGLAFINGPSSVVSSYRLGNGNGQRFYDRLCKVAVHEVGHNRGLPHCESPQCVMRDVVECIVSMDEAGRSLCDQCRYAANSQEGVFY